MHVLLLWNVALKCFFLWCSCYFVTHPYCLLRKKILIIETMYNMIMFVLVENCIESCVFKILVFICDRIFIYCISSWRSVICIILVFSFWNFYKNLTNYLQVKYYTSKMHRVISLDRHCVSKYSKFAKEISHSLCHSCWFMQILKHDQDL